MVFMAIILLAHPALILDLFLFLTVVHSLRLGLFHQSHCFPRLRYLSLKSHDKGQRIPYPKLVCGFSLHLEFLFGLLESSDILFLISILLTNASYNQILCYQSLLSKCIILSRIYPSIHEKKQAKGPMSIIS